MDVLLHTRLTSYLPNQIDLTCWQIADVSFVVDKVLKLLTSNRSTYCCLTD